MNAAGGCMLAVSHLYVASRKCLIKRFKGPLDAQLLSVLNLPKEQNNDQPPKIPVRAALHLPEV